MYPLDSLTVIGYHMPLRAKEDAEHAMVSAAALERIHAINELEEHAALEKHMASKGIEMSVRHEENVGKSPV